MHELVPWVNFSPFPYGAQSPALSSLVLNSFFLLISDWTADKYAPCLALRSASHSHHTFFRCVCGLFNQTSEGEKQNFLSFLFHSSSYILMQILLYIPKTINLKSRTKKILLSPSSFSKPSPLPRPQLIGNYPKLPS